MPIEKYEMDQFLTGLGFRLDCPPPANAAQSAQSISRFGFTYDGGLDRWHVVGASEILMPKEVTLEFHLTYPRARIPKSQHILE